MAEPAVPGGLVGARSDPGPEPHGIRAAPGPSWSSSESRAGSADLTRTILIGLACLGWAFVAWLSTHRSEAPEVLGAYSYVWLVFMAGSGLVALVLTGCCFGRPYRALHRTRRELLLLGISSLLAVALAEGIVRVFDPLGISYYEEMKRYRRALVPDEELVYKHPAHWNTVLQGVSVSTNEYGFRDSTIEAKQPGELRILMLGDSITFGWGVDAARTFARRLEPMLGDALHRRVRDINTAVAGYNTEQELAVLRRYYRVLAPDVVVLVVVSNDDEIAVRPDRDPGTRPSSMRDRTPPEILSDLRNRLWLYRVAYHLQHYGWYDEQPLPDSEGWRRALAAYEAFGQFCQDRHLACVTFYHRMYVSPKNAVFVRAFAGVADRHGWGFHDTRPWFPAQNDAKRLVNSIVDTHPNAEGHRVIAEHQAKVLVDLLRPRSGAHHVSPRPPRAPHAQLAPGASGAGATSRPVAPAAATKLRVAG